MASKRKATAAKASAMKTKEEEEVVKVFVAPLVLQVSEEEPSDQEESESEQESAGEDDEATTATDEVEVKNPGKKLPAKKKRPPKTNTKVNNETFLVTPVSYYDMLHSAIASCDDNQGISVVGIKKYFKEYYPDKDWSKIKSFIKKAISRGLKEGVFIRPKKSEGVVGLQGRFKINKEVKVQKKLTAVKSSDKPKKSSKTEESKGASNREAKTTTSKTATKETAKKTEKEKDGGKKGKPTKPQGTAEDTTKKSVAKKGRPPSKTKTLK